MSLVDLGNFCEHCGNLKKEVLVFSGDGPPYCFDCGYANGDISESALKYIEYLQKVELKVKKLKVNTNR